MKRSNLAASHRTSSRVGLEAHQRPGGTHRQRGTRAQDERAAIEESMAIARDWLDVLEQDLIFEEILEDTYRRGED